MEDILQNEIKRQEYMEMRYKAVDEEFTKPDIEDIFSIDRTGDKAEREDLEFKYIEEAFGLDKNKILEELGLNIQVAEEDVPQEESK